MLRKALIVITILILGLAGYASTFVVSYDRIHIAARPRAWLALFLGGWTLFYCLYFAKMGW